MMGWFASVSMLSAALFAAQFITIISTRDSVGERCGTRHLANHFKELAAAQ